jgi:hypothetical protein
MKISEVTMELLCQQLRENEEALSQSEKEIILILKDAAIRFIEDHTGIRGVDTEDENGRKLDDYEDLTYVFLACVAYMYDNRQMTVDVDKINPIAQSILSLHDFNIVPKGGML